jgi:hypothetical protein
MTLAGIKVETNHPIPPLHPARNADRDAVRRWALASPVRPKLPPLALRGFDAVLSTVRPIEGRWAAPSPDGRGPTTSSTS